MMIAPTDRRPFPLPGGPTPVPLPFPGPIVRPADPNGVVDRATHAALDGDGDGQLSQLEAGRAGWTQDRFNAFDANGDGKISEKEFTTGRRYEREFNEKDDNGNGYLTRMEFAGRKLIDDYFGGIGHKLVDGVEAASKVATGLIRPFTDRFARFDKDGDGKVTKEEYFAGRRREETPIKIDWDHVRPLHKADVA